MKPNPFNLDLAFTLLKTLKKVIIITHIALKTLGGKIYTIPLKV